MFPRPNGSSTPACVMLAISMFDTDQCAPLEIVCVLPSLKCPVSVIGCVSNADSGPEGEIESETNLAGFTVTASDPVTPCDVALALNEPASSPLNSPEPLITPMVLSLLLHRTAAVRSCVEPSL